MDWNSESPVTYIVRPANENEKRHFKFLASKAKGRFPNAKWHTPFSLHAGAWFNRERYGKSFIVFVLIFIKNWKRIEV